MTLWLWIAISVAVGIALGFSAAIYIPWFGTRKSETAFFFRRTKSHVWIYGPTVLYAMLYVGSAVWGMKVLLLKEWKTDLDAGKVLGEIDYEIFRSVLVWTAFTNALSFCSRKVAEIDGRKKKVEEETKSGLPDPNLR